MSGVDHGRDPCPDRVLDDIGTAFSMGVLGGSAWHFLRGMKNSPRGERFGGGVSAVRMNAPRIGGSFANWGALFASFDCTLVYLRKKEDPWNAIAAGAAAGASLQLRQGLKSAGKAAVMGGAILALIEGTGILLNRLLSQLPPPEEQQQQMGQMPVGVGMGAPMYSTPQAMPVGTPIPGYAAVGGGGGGGGGIDATSGLASMASASAGTSGGTTNLYGGSEIQLDGGGSSSSSSSFPPSSSSSGTSSSSSGSDSRKKSGSWFGGWLGGGSGTKEGGGDVMMSGSGSGSGASSAADRGIGGFDVNSSPPIPHFGSGTDNYSFK